LIEMEVAHKTSKPKRKLLTQIVSFSFGALICRILRFRIG